MSETVRRMLVRGIAAARAGDQDEARRYLERALYNDATYTQRAEAHLWLSRLSEDPEIQRDHLLEVLAGDPTNPEARRALAILDGHLDPQNVIDPDRVPAEDTPTDGSSTATPRVKRWVCPQCAGQMKFEPRKDWVQCAYCGHRQPVLTALRRQQDLDEHDFIVALATNKGHTIPAGLRRFQCRGCQATLETSGALSTHCPYCGSAHIVETDPSDAIAPEGIVPFAVTKGEATAAFRAWLSDEFGEKADRIRTTRVRGLYVPIWTFDLIGEVGWRGYENDGNRGAGGVSLSLSNGNLQLRAKRGGTSLGGRQVHTGTHYVMLDDLVVPATHTVPYSINQVFAAFDLSRAKSYDIGYLQDWPAECYTIKVSDASLVARQRALGRARRDVGIHASSQAGATLHNLDVFSRTLSVQAYKLVLVPVWLANYRDETATYSVAIDGQNGEAYGETPRGLGRALRGWFRDLF